MFEPAETELEWGKREFPRLGEMLDAGDLGVAVVTELSTDSRGFRFIKVKIHRKVED